MTPRSILAVLTVLGCFLCPFTDAFAESFGLSHESIQLQRTLPALVPLEGRSIQVVLAHQSNIPVELQAQLVSALEERLSKSSSKPRVVESGGEVVLDCVVTAYSQPKITTTNTQTAQPSIFSKSKILSKGGSPTTPGIQTWTAQGTVAVSFRVVASQGHQVLVSGSVTGSVYEQGDNGNIGGSLLDLHRKTPQPPPTPAQVNQEAFASAALQISSYIVNTPETITVYLARGGALDNANRLAANGLWQRYLETLETQQASGDPKSAAYATYDVGVANEALGYAAQDPKTAMKYLQQSSIAYDKAIDALPDEKYFIAPQQRILAALKHWETLKEAQNVKGAPSETGSPMITTVSSSHQGSPSGTSGAMPAGSSNNPPMTNADVITLVQGHVDSDNVLDDIQHAPSVHFDLTPKGQAALAKAGVNGPILRAMKQRQGASQ